MLREIPVHSKSPVNFGPRRRPSPPVHRYSNFFPRAGTSQDSRLSTKGKVPGEDETHYDVKQRGTERSHGFSPSVYKVCSVDCETTLAF